MSSKIDKLKRNCSVSSAAKILLEHHLNNVRQQHMKAAFILDGDIEHIHRLRVSTRRSIAALHVFDEFLPKKHKKNLVTKLNLIRDVAAKARDLDVLIQRRKLSPKCDRALIKILSHKRDKAQKPIVKSFHQLRKKHFFRDDLNKIRKSLDKNNSTKKQKYSKWAQQNLARYVDAFFDQRPLDVASPKQLHRFRIAAKKFRYTIEILQPAFPPKAFSKVAKEFKHLQELLGHVNDHAVAESKLRRMKKAGTIVKNRVFQNEVDQLQSAIEEFANWWTKETIHSLRKKFHQLEDL